MSIKIGSGNRLPVGIARAFIGATKVYETEADLPRTMPVFQSAASSTDAAGVTSKPSGTVEGDFLIGMFFAYAAEIDSDIGLPAGWTAVGSTLRFGSGAFGENFFGKLAHKFAGASEPSTYTHTIIGGGSYRCASILRVTSVDASAPIGDTDVTTGGPDGTRNIASSSSPYDNALQVIFSEGIYGIITSTPSGATQRAETDSGVGRVYTKNLPTAGATGALSHTQTTPGDPHQWGTVSVVLNGAP